MIKHATASTFVFAQIDGDWMLGMVVHPRLGKVMAPGGHTEGDETNEEAALRETLEETGLAVRLIEPDAPKWPAGYPHLRVAQPWWISELPVPPDNYLPSDHVHVDHVYVAVADSVVPVSRAAHEFRWLSARQVAESDDVFEDTKLLAAGLFAAIGELSRVAAP
jgi:8-oxo-dGTP pyrophosphatase MutT (NUDIX family)